MPLLPREIEILPANLFELPAEPFPWGVAHVRSRQEKVLARHLVQHDVPFYLPLVPSTRERAGRKLTSYLPLFGGYVFFRGAARERDVVRRSGVTAAILDVPQPELLAAELEQIRRLQLAGATFKPVADVAVGDPVQVSEGSFRGYRGIVLREKGQDRLVVQISLIRHTVAVELPREILARAR